LPDPGSAFFRCCSANTPDGVTDATVDITLFLNPLTTSPSPFIIASKPTCATFECQHVSHCGAFRIIVEIDVRCRQFSAPRLYPIGPFLEIKNERDYQKALKEIDQLMDAGPNTPEGDRLDVLVTLVEAWEEKHCTGRSTCRILWRPFCLPWSMNVSGMVDAQVAVIEAELLEDTLAA
jgi:hypothetical protein